MAIEPLGSIFDPEHETPRIEVVDYTAPRPEPTSHPLLVAMVVIAAGIAAGVSIVRAFRKWRWVREQGHRNGPPLGPYRTSNTAN